MTYSAPVIEPARGETRNSVDPLGAFPRVQMPGERSLPPTNVAIAAILASSLWALQNPFLAPMQAAADHASFGAGDRAAALAPDGVRLAWAIGRPGAAACSGSALDDPSRI
jgi:hypothetical protein